MVFCYGNPGQLRHHLTLKYGCHQLEVATQGNIADMVSLNSSALGLIALISQLR